MNPQSFNMAAAAAAQGQFKQGLNPGLQAQGQGQFMTDGISQDQLNLYNSHMNIQSTNAFLSNQQMLANAQAQAAAAGVPPNLASATNLNGANAAAAAAAAANFRNLNFLGQPAGVGGAIGMGVPGQ
ncbi:hypothetical protein HK102_011359, partial [Quaeritorhiza haematococci]